MCAPAGQEAFFAEVGVPVATRTTPALNLVAQYNESCSHRPVNRVEDLAELALRHDEHAALLLESAGERLGEGLANLATLFDPNLIIIGGEGVAPGEALLKPMKRAFERRRFPKTAPVELTISTWGDDAWARSAAGLVVEHFFGALPTSLGEKVG